MELLQVDGREPQIKPSLLHANIAQKINWRNEILAGGGAGLIVDVALFPLDTIKTRVQSHSGFLASGGFSRLYSGLAATAVCSGPNSAIFFCTYEYCKCFLLNRKRYENVNNKSHDKDVSSSTYESTHMDHMLCATAGETTALAFRMPFEVVKQRRQASQTQTNCDSQSKSAKKMTTSVTASSSIFHIIKDIWNTSKIYGFYRGSMTTWCREIPFVLLQFPLWEYFKSLCTEVRGVSKAECTSYESALSGAVSGAIAGIATTPIDVAKTRIILAPHGSTLALKPTLATALLMVYREGGVRATFNGVVARATMISVGGCVFFGGYDCFKNVLS